MASAGVTLIVLLCVGVVPSVGTVSIGLARARSEDAAEGRGTPVTMGGRLLVITPDLLVWAVAALMADAGLCVLVMWIVTVHGVDLGSALGTIGAVGVLVLSGALAARSGRRAPGGELTKA